MVRRWNGWVEGIQKEGEEAVGWEGVGDEVNEGVLRRLGEWVKGLA